MFAGLPPSAPELTERKSVAPASPLPNGGATSRIYRRRRARSGSRAAALRRGEPTRSSSVTDDERFSGAIRSELQRAIKQKTQRLRSCGLQEAMTIF
jgi:hypothetical protein